MDLSSIHEEKLEQLGFFIDGDKADEMRPPSIQPAEVEEDTEAFKAAMWAGQANILVAVRLRPHCGHDRDNGEIVKVLDNKVVVVLDQVSQRDPLRKMRHRSREKRYAFDYVFSPEDGQEKVYTNTTKFLIHGVLNGFNATVFAYGCTGAGKTYTMLGTPDQPGIMALTLKDLFENIDRIHADAQATVSYKVSVSFLEVYNENIRDLLAPVSNDYLDLREDPLKGPVVAGISEIEASNAEEVMKLLRRGNKNRTQEATAANAVSSRSHAVLQVLIEQSEKNPGTSATVKFGKLSLVDLAGSERAAVTQNRGQRLLEGANINRSLLALGNCINALGEKASQKGAGFVPYRDSKLTRLLKDSLGGNCRTVMIANVSMAASSFEETVNTLKYANRAKNIKTTVTRNVLNVNHHITEYVSLITSLKEEIVVLKKQLEYQSFTARGPRDGIAELKKHRHHHNNNDEDDDIEDEPTDVESIPHGSNEGDDSVKRRSFRQARLTIMQSFQERLQLRRSLIELENQNVASSVDIGRRQLMVTELERQREEKIQEDREKWAEQEALKVSTSMTSSTSLPSSNVVSPRTMIPPPRTGSGSGSRSSRLSAAVAVAAAAAAAAAPAGAAGGGGGGAGGGAGGGGSTTASTTVTPENTCFSPEIVSCSSTGSLSIFDPKEVGTGSSTVGTMLNISSTTTNVVVPTLKIPQPPCSFLKMPISCVVFNLDHQIQLHMDCIEKLQTKIDLNQKKKLFVMKKIKQNEKKAEEFRTGFEKTCTNEEKRDLLLMEYRIGKLELDKMELEETKIVHENIVCTKNLEIQKLQLQLQVKDQIVTKQQQILEQNGLVNQLNYGLFSRLEEATLVEGFDSLMTSMARVTLRTPTTKTSSKTTKTSSKTTKTSTKTTTTSSKTTTTKGQVSKSLLRELRDKIAGSISNVKLPLLSRSSTSGITTITTEQDQDQEQDQEQEQQEQQEQDQEQEEEEDDDIDDPDDDLFDLPERLQMKKKKKTSSSKRSNSGSKCSTSPTTTNGRRLDGEIEEKKKRHHGSSTTSIRSHHNRNRNHGRIISVPKEDPAEQEGVEGSHHVVSFTKLPDIHVDVPTPRGLTVETIDTSSPQCTTGTDRSENPDSISPRRQWTLNWNNTSLPYIRIKKNKSPLKHQPITKTKASLSPTMTTKTTSTTSSTTNHHGTSNPNPNPNPNTNPNTNANANANAAAPYLKVLKNRRKSRKRSTSSHSLHTPRNIRGGFSDQEAEEEEIDDE